MPVDSIDRYVKLVSDILTGKSLCNQACHFGLTPGQRCFEARFAEYAFEPAFAPEGTMYLFEVQAAVLGNIDGQRVIFSEIASNKTMYYAIFIVWTIRLAFGVYVSQRGKCLWV